MKNKLLILILTLVVVSLTGCFGLTESLLNTLFPQPKNEVKEEEPVTKTITQVSTVTGGGAVRGPNIFEYRWWYTGYHNLRQPYLRFPHSLWWYDAGRWCWWRDNINPRYWPKPGPRLRRAPKPHIIVERGQMIPRAPKVGIDNYVDTGCPTGSFLYAVLSNDLFEAVARADSDNRLALASICEYIYNYTPNTCHGSPEKVAAWKKFHAEQPEEAHLAAGGDRERRAHYYDKH